MSTHDTIMEWSQALTTSADLGEFLGISPCETLAVAFPAIVDDDEMMGALAALLEPAMAEVGLLVARGAVSLEAGETFVHNVFHILQIAAALGHMVALDQCYGAVVDIPGDLSDVAWDDLPTILEDI